MPNTRDAGCSRSIFILKFYRCRNTLFIKDIAVHFRVSTTLQGFSITLLIAFAPCKILIQDSLGFWIPRYK